MPYSKKEEKKKCTPRNQKNHLDETQILFYTAWYITPVVNHDIRNRIPNTQNTNITFWV